MDLTLTVKQKAIRKMARQFAENELAPIAREIDAERRFPWEVIVVKGYVRSELHNYLDIVYLLELLS